MSRVAKILFSPHLSKIDQKKSGKIANALTIKTYREIWNELGSFAKHELNLIDMQALESHHIEEYMRQKMTHNITEQRAELISSAIGKLQTGLEHLGLEFNNSYQYKPYDFEIRKIILKEARQLGLIKETSKQKNYSRAYENPLALIDAISDERYKLAAKIQFESGTRLEGILEIYRHTRIKTLKLQINKLEHLITIEKVDREYSIVHQLNGIKKDEFTQTLKGQLLTVEKGGKPGIVQLDTNTYWDLDNIIRSEGKFIINKNIYRKLLKEASQKTAQKYQSTHGLRWNFAQNRMKKLQSVGLSYKQAQQQVSLEMKHFRSDITDHYLS